MRPPRIVKKGSDRITWQRLVVAASALLVTALFALGNPFVAHASASAVPVVFPLESRVPVGHMFFAARSGHLHQGIDLMAPKMTKEVAAVGGTVTLQQRMWQGHPWYTLWLAGDDGRGYYYSHINNDTPGTDDNIGNLAYAFAPGLHTGDHVNQGQFLAYCGDSGNAEGGSPHLHFEIHETTSMFSLAMDPYDSLYGAPLANGTPPPAWPVPQLTSYEQTNSKVTYTGAWTTLVAGEASGGDYTYADSKGEAIIWFEGTRLDLVATRGTTQGIASVSLDGAPPQPIDLHNPATLGKQVVWSSGTLTQGTHTVSVAWTGERSVPDGGTRINIDALTITGTLLQGPAIATFQETNSLLSYAGGWTATSDTSASGGTFRSVDSSGASAVAQFTGVYAAWVANKGQGYGMAKVTLDQNDPVTVDLYNANTLYGQKVWTSGIIGYGVHVIKIERSGLGNQAATGTTINLDALQSIGALDAVGAATWEGPTAGTTIGPPAPGGSFIRYDQTDTSIVKTGTWTDFPKSVAYFGSYGRSSTPGASVTVWFTGTKIAWIGMKGSTPGIVDVYLDDVKKATLDLYASPAQYQVPLWASDTLSDGTHHMDLVRNKDSLSTEFVVLDAVDIWGNIAAAPPTITSLSAASGPVDGGTSVTITGTGFTGVSAVTFDGVKATSYTVNSSTKITATAPPHAAGNVPVQVTTSAGTASSTFTYEVAPRTTRVDVLKTTTVTTPGTLWGGTWSSFASTSAYNASYMRSSTAGAYVLIAFKGTRLDWITMKGTTGGIADIYVDGSTTKAATINLYVSSPVYQRNLWSTGVLADGYHTVKILRSGSSLSGRYVTVDAVEVAGTLVAPRIEENASPSPFAWNPAFASWTTGTTTSASGGTYKYINSSGAYVSFSFTGVGFQLLARTAPSYGNLTVTVDGVSQTASLYSATIAYKKIVYTKFVAPGKHTVKISRAGTKSSSSTGYTIDLDAIDLYGVTG